MASGLQGLSAFGLGVRPKGVVGGTPAPDTTPDAFAFTDQTNVALSTLIASDAITVAGITAAATVTVSGGEYQKNGGAWVTGAGTAALGDTFKVRRTSSNLNSTAVGVTLTIGGVSDTFTLTTAAAGPFVPSFDFRDGRNSQYVPLIAGF